MTQYLRLGSRTVHCDYRRHPVRHAHRGVSWAVAVTFMGVAVCPLLAQGNLLVVDGETITLDNETDYRVFRVGGAEPGKLVFQFPTNNDSLVGVGLNVGFSGPGEVVQKNGRISGTSLLIGRGANGIYKLEEGRNTVLKQFLLGWRAEGITGTYQLDGGLLETIAGEARGDLAIGDVAIGVFIQNGGTHHVVDDLRLGIRLSGEGKYEMNAGTLLVDDELTVGSGSTRHLHPGPRFHRARRGECRTAAPCDGP